MSVPMNDFDDYRHSGDAVSFLFLNGVQVWPRGCVIEIHAAATGNTYSPPRASINLDEAGLINPCELDVGLQFPSLAVLNIPPGDYSGATATIEWGDGASAECFLFVEEDDGSPITSDTATSTTPVDLSVGAFTVTSSFGRVYIVADFTVAGGSHTIDPATVITITKT